MKTKLKLKPKFYKDQRLLVKFSNTPTEMKVIEASRTDKYVKVEFVWAENYRCEWFDIKDYEILEIL